MNKLKTVLSDFLALFSDIPDDEEHTWPQIIIVFVVLFLMVYVVSVSAQ